MKKSIAFLGALLFGSVTFGQVTKNDNTNKPSSRKVSSEDLKKFPEDVEATTNTGTIKGETLEKHKGDLIEKHKGDEAISQQSKTHIKLSNIEKQSSDASAGTGSKIKGTVTQKGKESTMTTEKQHYTIKLTNANKQANPVATEQTDSGDGEATTQKKHISNIKWSGDKVAKDSLPTPTSKSSDMYLKIGDIKGEK